MDRLDATQDVVGKRDGDRGNGGFEVRDRAGPDQDRVDPG